MIVQNKPKAHKMWLGSIILKVSSNLEILHVKNQFGEAGYAVVCSFVYAGECLVLMLFIM